MKISSFWIKSDNLTNQILPLERLSIITYKFFKIKNADLIINCKESGIKDRLFYFYRLRRHR